MAPHVPMDASRDQPARIFDQSVKVPALVVQRLRPGRQQPAVPGNHDPGEHPNFRDARWHCAWPDMADKKSERKLTGHGRFPQSVLHGGYRVVRTAFLVTTLLVADASPVLAQDVAAGEKDFLVCRACHQIGSGAKSAIGPVLNGVVGRKAGTYPGFQYSDANRDSGIVWTPDELDKYLTSPQTVMPHTKMIFPGLNDAQKRKDVIAFLEQFGPDGVKKQ